MIVCRIASHCERIVKPRRRYSVDLGLNGINHRWPEREKSGSMDPGAIACENGARFAWWGSKGIAMDSRGLASGRIPDRDE